MNKPLNPHRRVWSGLEKIGIMRNRLWTELLPCRPRHGAKKIWFCAVLGAALLAAVEEKGQQDKAESQITVLLQDLVRTLQVQLEEERANAR